MSSNKRAAHGRDGYLFRVYSQFVQSLFSSSRVQTSHTAGELKVLEFFKIFCGVPPSLRTRWSQFPDPGNL